VTTSIDPTPDAPALSGRERRHEAARRGSPLQISFALIALAMGGFGSGTRVFTARGTLSLPLR